MQIYFAFCGGISHPRRAGGQPHDRRQKTDKEDAAKEIANYSTEIFHNDYSNNSFRFDARNVSIPMPPSPTITER